MGDLGSVPGLGRSPGEGKDYALQYSGLENTMDCTVHEVAKSQTQLNDFHLNLFCYILKLKTMFLADNLGLNSIFNSYYYICDL